MANTCPRCRGTLQWRQEVRAGRTVNWAECQDCNWKSIVEEPTYPQKIAFTTWFVYIAIGVILWTLFGIAAVLIAIYITDSSFLVGVRPWLLLFAFLVLYGGTMGHVLHYLLVIGQRNQNVSQILVLPRILFAVAGALLGLLLNSLQVIGWPYQICIGTFWIRVIVGALIGYIVVGPVIRTARFIRIGIGVR